MKNGWEIKMLSDVCDTGAGGTPLKAHKDYYEGGNIPWLQSGEVSQGEIYEARNFITEIGLKNSSARLFPKDTVLIAMYGATAGQVGILRFPATTNQAVCGILPNNKTIPEFLYYCFLYKKDELIAQAVGGAQPNISQIKIKNTIIPLPPLPEQHRIVTILDEVFAVIAKAKENAEKNLANAREVFEAYLQSVFANRGEGWRNETLGNLSCINYGYTEKATFEEVGLKFLRITDIQNNDVVWEGVPYCKCSDEDIPKYKLESGDIVFARTGATTGKSYLLNNPPPSVFASYLIRLRIKNKAELQPTLLYYYFQTKNYWDNINAGISGSAQGGFNASKLSELSISFPRNPEEQQLIVFKLDSFFAETKKLESIYHQKLADLDELKKSILEKAFAGELNTN